VPLHVSHSQMRGQVSMGSNACMGQDACSGIYHVVEELAEKVVCWVDSGGSSCISWALGSGPMPEVAFWIGCVQLVQCLVELWL